MDESRWIWGEGPKPCKVLVCGEAPGKDEIARGRPFVGITGMEVNQLLRREAGLNREDCYLTNYCKRFLGDKKDMGESEKALWNGILTTEIEEVDPDIILSLGALATNFFLTNQYDMEAYNGTPHRWENRVLIPSFHPAAGFRDLERMGWVTQAFQSVRAVLQGKARIWTPGDKTEIVDVLVPGEIVSVDTESLRDGRPYLVSASTEKGKAFVEGPPFKYVKDFVAKKTVVLHNALWDLPVLERMGIHVDHFIDTMQIAFLIQTLPLGLKMLAYKLCGMRMREYEDVVGERKDLSEVPIEEVRQYAGEDADATLRVYYRMLLLFYDRMGEVLQRDLDIMPMVVAMMQRGMSLDTEMLYKMDVEMSLANFTLKSKIEEITKTPFNPKSAKQCAELLYGKLGLGKQARIKRTKFGGSTDTKSLGKIRNDHPVVKMIEEYRSRQDLIDKYISVLPEKVDTDGCIHPKISMVRVKHSGRFATTNPNLLAQPVRTEDGLKIRNAFVAREGYKLVSFDYNQIEMRLLAHLSQDESLLDIYKRNGDVHSETAASMFRIPLAKVTKKERDPAKNTGFGVVYRISPRGLYDQFVKVGIYHWSEDDCEGFIDGWYHIHPGVKRYQNQVDAEVRRNGYVTDFFGRRLYLPAVRAYNARTREDALRKAGNMPIQSGAQGIIKEAMRQLWPNTRRWMSEGVVYLLLQIHDDLLYEIKDDLIDYFILGIKNVMENTVKLSIPTPVEAKVGDRWGSMKKV